MDHLLCPVCRGRLKLNSNALQCENRHCFDIAKEGYVNLLTGSKAGALIGDNKDMAKSRKSFLDKGYFSPLAQGLAEIAKSNSPETVLDICCGEGYYTAFIKEKVSAEIYGFDISKEMVRLAAKRKSGAHFFVANMADIPLADASIDLAFHLFAPFCEKEFARVIKPGGLLISVCPGKRHLFEMKAKLYDSPYENEEAAPRIEGFETEKAQNITANIKLDCQEDIDSLFRMTPYYYHTSAADKEKLKAIESLETQTDFYIRTYRRK